MSRAPSKAPSQAPSQSPSQAPSRVPSQSPSSLAETSAPPQSPSSKAPYMTTIAEGAGSISPSPEPIHPSPSHAPSRAPTSSSSSRAPRGTYVPSVSASRAPSSSAAIARSQDPHTIAATSRWVDSGGASSHHTQVPTLSNARFAAPSAAPTVRITRSIVPSAVLHAAADVALPPTTIAPAGRTEFPTTSRDPQAAPTMIPTASGVPVASRWTSKADIAAATRQVNYAQLGREEKRVQDKWAKEKADQFAPCPANWPWMRHETRELPLPPFPLPASAFLYAADR
ncbi:uncharacterized protein PG986_001057 [Apiospora aurea]|uniref:Uncharacterized protein n=1 Tax=Apiospora aurea TaxID=335848 RepID=A0ABR1QXH1_9PEZI